MGKLAKFIGSQPGYFEENREDDFPWEEQDRIVWYALLLVESGKIIKYGFTPSKSSKRNLIEALKSIEQEDEYLLLGVWTGKYFTSLFILDKDIAIKKLEQASE